MAGFLQACKAAGLSVTAQRQAIYAALLESEDHPSPEALYRRVRPAQPNLSLATVYKALEALARLGVAGEVSALSATRRYDGNLDRHHHLVCTGCQKVRDLYDAGLDRVAVPRGLGGFAAQTVSVQVLGLCAECSRKGQRPRVKGGRPAGRRVAGSPPAARAKRN